MKGRWIVWIASFWMMGARLAFGESPAFRVVSATWERIGGEAVSAITSEACRAWVDDLGTDVVFRGHGVETRLWREPYGVKYNSIVHLHVRAWDEPDVYLHLILQVRSTGIGIESGRYEGWEIGCSLQTGIGRGLVIELPCQGVPVLWPVVLMSAYGEGLVLGSGVWDGRYVWTAPHVAGNVGVMDVWGWDGERWALGVQQARFTCNRSVCVAQVGLDGTRFRPWRPSGGSRPVLLLTMPAEPPKAVEAPEEVMQTFVLYKDPRKAPHVHAGASGSALAWYDGRNWHLLGVLVGGGHVVSVDGKNHFYLYYSPVCTKSE